MEVKFPWFFGMNPFNFKFLNILAFLLMLIVMLTPGVWSDVVFRKSTATPKVKIGNIFSGRECRGGTRLDQKYICRIVSSLLNLNRSISDLVILIIVQISFHLKVDKGWKQT